MRSREESIGDKCAINIPAITEAAFEIMVLMSMTKALGDEDCCTLRS